MSVFSAAWQAQRDVARKRCPACGGEVEATFSGKRYAICLASLTAFGWLTYALLHLPLATAFGVATLGVGFSLLPSLQLQKVPTTQLGLRARLSRRIELPAWLSPPEWLRKAARALWALGSCLFAGVAVVVGLPPPWPGVLLVLVGAVGFARRQLWFSWFQLTGIGAQLLSGAWLLAGIVLLVSHYA